MDGNGSASIEGSTLTVNPSQDYNGDIEVTVIASDGQASGSGNFTLNVTPVNDAPDFVGDQTIFEDESLVLELYATDVEGYAGNLENLYLQYSAYVPWGDSQNVQVGVIQNQVTFTHVVNFNGELTLRVTVSDGTDLTEEEFNLTVLPMSMMLQNLLLHL